MVWVLGMIALLQVVALPGALLLRWVGSPRLNAIERAVGAFACSLMVNYFLVALFTLARVQRPVTWCVVIGAELIYFGVSWRSWIGFWSFDTGKVVWPKRLSWEWAIAGVLLAASLVVLIALFYSNWGSVYTGTDDVANWDHWATEWSSGNFPALTGLYPQLLPANGSLSYLLIGNTDIKMFSKATTPLYMLATVLLFFSLGIRRRDPSFWIGGTLYTVMVLHYMGPAFMTYGYADLPVAFFGFLAFYCIAASSDPPDRLAVMAMLFFSAGALLTKQGGVYVVAAAVLYAFKRRARLFQRDAPSVLVALFGAFCAAWYLAKFVQIQMGTDSSNMTLLTQVLHQGRNYWQRVAAIYGKFLYEPPSNAYYTLPLSCLLLASLFFKRTRKVTALVIFPFLMAYAFWFSYEIRNCLMAFPLIALVCGAVLWPKGNPAQVSAPVSRGAVIPVGAIGLLALAAFAGWSALRYPAQEVLAQQADAARKTIGDRAITENLYKAVKEKNINSGIVTYYWFLRGLPGINQQFRRTGACHPCTAEAMETALAKYPGAGYILMPDGVMPTETRKDLQSSREFVTVFDVDGWRLLKKETTSPHSVP